jgi:hypothetical protein
MGIANLILLSVTIVLLAWIFLLLLRRRVFRQFPFFVAYIAYSLLATVGLVAISANYRLYFYGFWVNEACLALLAVLALHEVFRRVFFGFYVQAGWFRLLFPAVVIAVLVIAILAAGHGRPLQGSSLRKAILLFGLTVNLLQIGLFCLFVALGRTLLLRWRFAPLGILLGFTATAFGSTIDYWAISEFGTKLESITKYVPPVAYILATAVWLDTFLRPEPGPGSVSAASLREVAEAIRQDTAAIRQFLEKKR